MSGSGDKSSVDVVLAQLDCAAHDPEANVATADQLIAEHSGADLIVFPETYLSGYPATSGFEDVLFESAGDQRLSRLNDRAVEAGTHVVIGALIRIDGGIGNAAFVLGDPAGPSYVLKSHGWGQESDGSFHLANQLGTVDVAGIPSGVMICFDMEFPEVARSLALAGSRLLISIAANMEPYGRDHLRIAQVRAIENSLPHLYVNRIGTEDGVDFVGGSAAFAADGEELVVAGNSRAVLELKLALEPNRPAASRIDYLRQRRSELYGALTSD